MKFAYNLKHSVLGLSSNVLSGVDLVSQTLNFRSGGELFRLNAKYVCGTLPMSQSRNGLLLTFPKNKEQIFTRADCDGC